jgi:hypothetical protein
LQKQGRKAAPERYFKTSMVDGVRNGAKKRRCDLKMTPAAT